MSEKVAKMLGRKARRLADPKLKRKIHANLPYVRYAARGYITIQRLLKKAYRINLKLSASERKQARRHAREVQHG